MRARSSRATGQFQLISDPDNPNGLVKQPIVNITPDNAGDTITIFGNDGGADNFTVSAVDPVNDRMTDVRVVHIGDASVLITKQIRAEGDRLVIDGRAGNDRIDASALGGDGTPTVFPDLIAVSLKGSAGDDVLIGSPFADALDGGTGNDHLTGGPGLDTFADGSLPGRATSTRSSRTSTSTCRLFQDTFIVGQLRSNDNSTRFSDPDYVSETDIRSHMTTDDNPNFRNGLTDGDHYASARRSRSSAGSSRRRFSRADVEQHDRRQRQRQHRLHRRRRPPGHAVAGSCDIRDPRMSPAPRAGCRRNSVVSQRRHHDRAAAIRLCASPCRANNCSVQPRFWQVSWTPRSSVLT